MNIVDKEKRDNDRTRKNTGECETIENIDDKQEGNKTKIKVEGDQEMKMGYLYDLWSFCNQARASGVEDPVKRMQPLKDWSLLPCMIGDRCFLTPISNRYHVFHIDSEVTVREVLVGHAPALRCP